MNHTNLPLFNKYSFCEKFKVTSDPSAFSAVNYFECGALVPAWHTIMALVGSPARASARIWLNGAR